MNNFDTSSSGVNLELTCFYDTQLSHDWFHHDFEILQHSGIGQGSILLATEGGTYSKDDLGAANIDNKGLARHIIENYYENSVQGARDFLTDSTAYCYLRELTFECWLEIIENFLHTIAALELIAKYSEPNYIIESVVGYCQSDYSQVIIFKKSHLYSSKSIVQHLTNSIFGAPLNVRLSVDNEEHYIDEHLRSLYNYDIEEILVAVKKELSNHDKIDYILNWVAENLPKYPDTL